MTQSKLISVVQTAVLLIDYNYHHFENATLAQIFLFFGSDQSCGDVMALMWWAYDPDK